MLMNDMNKCDKLREQINESLWTGAVMETKGLVSLKDILQNETNQGEQEQYVMLSTILNLEDKRDPYSRDRHLVINRTPIDFNKRSCRLISFTDVSFKQRYQVSQRNNHLIDRGLTTTNNLAVEALDECIFTIDQLSE